MVPCFFVFRGAWIGFLVDRCRRRARHRWTIGVGGITVETDFIAVGVAEGRVEVGALGTGDRVVVESVQVVAVRLPIAAAEGSSAIK